MFLHDMSLAELDDLIGSLNTISEVMANLEGNDLSPRLSMLPGRPTVITLSAVLPMFSEMAEVAPSRVTPEMHLATMRADFHRRNEEASVVVGPVSSYPECRPEHGLEHYYDGVSPPDDEADVVIIEDEIPAGPQQQAEAAPRPVAAAPRPVAAAPMPVAAPEPEPEPKKPFDRPWTADEERRLVATIAEAMTQGAPKSVAMAAAARAFERTEKAIAVRVYRNLRMQLVQALEALARPGLRPETAEVEQSGIRAKSPAAPAAGEGQAALATPAATALDAYVAGLPTKDGWTPARDLEIMDLSVAGWQAPEIAMELQVSSADIKARFALLLGSFRDGDDKEQKRFRRDEVLAALKIRAGKVAA